MPKHIQAHKNQKAFTLVELLVVISIIGLLSSVVFASVSSARAKARDSKRMSEIKQLQLALEMYKDKYGGYPDSTDCSTGVATSWWCYSGYGVDSNGHWIEDNDAAARGAPGTLAEFLVTDPLDPKQVTVNGLNETNNYNYFSTDGYGGVNNDWYMIVFRLESYPNNQELSDGVLTPGNVFFDYGRTYVCYHPSGSYECSATAGTERRLGIITWGNP